MGNGTVALFNKGYSIPVYTVNDFTEKSIVSIANSFIELKVKGSKKIVKYEDFSKIFVVDSLARLFIFDFAKEINVLLFLF